PDVRGPCRRRVGAVMGCGCAPGPAVAPAAPSPIHSNPAPARLAAPGSSHAPDHRPHLESPRIEPPRVPPGRRAHPRRAEPLDVVEPPGSRPGLASAQGEVVPADLHGRRAEPPRTVGPQAGPARRGPRRVPAQPIRRPRPDSGRTPAPPSEG